MAGQPVSPDTALASYAAVLSAVRGATRDEPLALRSADLLALAAALDTDDHDVEARIRALLGCSSTEAHRVHRELVRRRLLRPVAALAAGSLLVWGPAAAARSDRPKLLPLPSTTTQATGPTTTSNPGPMDAAPAVASAPGTDTDTGPDTGPARPGPAPHIDILPGESPAASRAIGSDQGESSSSVIGASSAFIGASSTVAEITDGDAGAPGAERSEG